jgi:RNA polymerase sigma factor (sigma-70 family)
MNRGKMADESHDEIAFAALYEKYSPVIYRLAYRWLGNHEEAADLTNSAFLKLHQTMKADKLIESPKTWIYSVAVNLCRDSLRRTIKYRGILRENYRDHSRTEIIPTGNHEQEIALMRGAMGQLPKRDRILLLLYQDDLSYAEMAQATGIKITSIGKTLSRAIAHLANALKNGDGR